MHFKVAPLNVYAAESYGVTNFKMWWSLLSLSFTSKELKFWLLH